MSKGKSLGIVEVGGGEQKNWTFDFHESSGQNHDSKPILPNFLQYGTFKGKKM